MNGCIYNKEFNPNDVKNPIVQWIIYEVKNIVLNVENAIENYSFNEAARHIYKCLWSSFCDWYIEFIKPVLQYSALTENTKQGYDLQYTLLKKDIRDTTEWAILQFIRVLYPIASFIAKKLSGKLPNTHSITADFSDFIKKIELLKEIITSIHSMKKYMDIPLGKKLASKIKTNDQLILDLIKENSLMAWVEIKQENGLHTISMVVGNAILHMDFVCWIDVKAELAHLYKEILKLEKAKKKCIGKTRQQRIFGESIGIYCPRA